MEDRRKALQVLILNTVAFTVCFAGWMMNGVLITFLVDNDVFTWDKAQMGWLIGIPVLTGAVMRLPVGVLTDKYGGRRVYTILMLVSAVPMYLTSMANEYYQFLVASLGFGLSGASFAVGIAYTSVWFPKGRQGTALGIFGVGNAGAALTSLGAPTLLRYLTDGGTNLDAWRTLPKIYALALVIMAAIFYSLTFEKRTAHSSSSLSIKQRLEPLKYIRVWRFGLYYFLVFGAFVALAQWLIPYYVNVYSMSVATAGMMAAIFSLPSGVTRALGGVISDKFGARRVMYWVLGSCLAGCALLCVPRMDIESPGPGVVSARAGTVTFVNDTLIRVDQREYAIRSEPTSWQAHRDNTVLVFPSSEFWHEPVVNIGDQVVKKQLLARGITHLFFQANVWVFTFILLLVGFMMGMGMAAVYRHIPDYYPEQIGVVGGVVGVVGGLGGFFCPILFGYMLKWTGIWTTSWIFLAALSFACLIWMHFVVQKMMREQAPTLMKHFESRPDLPVEASQ
ncbi:NarK/NasA family nitrate transporter [bacterium]|nr:NarK/NasA family nitrate transporter [bacterium]